MNDNAQWPNNRNQHGGSNYRKQGAPDYSDNKGKNYSPSASYNYTKSGRGGGQSYQQHPRRRIDRYKRESYNSNDKLIKQNDIIIRILKEIRDKLIGPDKVSNDIKQVKIEKNDQLVESVETTPVSEEESPQEGGEEVKELESESPGPEETLEKETVAEVSEPAAEDSDDKSQEISSK